MTYPVVVYGAPHVPPAPPVKQFRPGHHKWIGWDGSEWSEWNLGDWRVSGVCFADGELDGMDFPPFDRYTSTSPATAGSRFRGFRTAERTVDWNILVYSKKSSAEWLEVDRAFAATLGPGRTGVWEYTSPDGVTRSLRLRRVAGDGGPTMDPALKGYALYQPQMVAEDPYWKGKEIVRAWGSPAQEDFFSDDDTHLFYISGASTLGTATMPNPGDVEAWPIITIDGTEGAMTNLSVEIDGGTVGLPDVALGEVLVVNTDPEVATALLDGVDVSGVCDPWDPRGLPPGEDVPVTIAATGTGTVSLSIVPRYFRAW